MGVVVKKMRVKSKAQGLTEYSICLVIVIMTLMGMQLYVKRGLQGRLKSMVDEVTTNIAAPRQYEPYYVYRQVSRSAQSDTEETMSTGGKVRQDFGNCASSFIWFNTKDN